MFNSKLIKTLKKTINNLEKELNEKDVALKEYQKEHEILLNNASELRAKIVDLESNIELLVNNLSDENKELISDFDNQN